MKYFFELILEDELSDLKRENKTKQCLIEIANEQVNKSYLSMTEFDFCLF